MLEPTSEIRAELVIRKSRFIGYGIPAATVDAADSALAVVRRRHADASHVAHAYLVGAPAREIGSMTDAGEPKGTAGRPVMEILRGSDVRNVVIAVVRYFGGTKLGTGGLVRAYGDTAREVLKTLPTRPLVIRDQLEVTVGYGHHDAVRRILLASGAEIVAEVFDTDVSMRVLVERVRAQTIQAEIGDATSGSARIVRSGE